MFIRTAVVACEIAVGALGSTAAGPRLEPHIAANAPEDKPRQWNDQSKAAAALAPYIAKAKATYPYAKARYAAGLPAGQSFFVTVELRDGEGRSERVFLVVDEITKAIVHGRIWNEVVTVEGFKFGQQYSVPESEVIDWTITRPDGTEEGNYIGKFIDSLQEAEK